MVISVRKIAPTTPKIALLETARSQYFILADLHKFMGKDAHLGTIVLSTLNYYGQLQRLI